MRGIFLLMGFLFDVNFYSWGLLSLHLQFDWIFKTVGGSFQNTLTHTHTTLRRKHTIVTHREALRNSHHFPFRPSPMYTTLSFLMAIRRCVVHVLADIFINNNGFFDLCMSFRYWPSYLRLFLTFTICHYPIPILLLFLPETSPFLYDHLSFFFIIPIPISLHYHNYSLLLPLFRFRSCWIGSLSYRQFYY